MKRPYPIHSSWTAAKLAIAMAPYHSGILHQGRDDDNDDSGDGYYHPAVIFFGLLLLCLCIMAPMIWMIWLMRNDNRDSGLSYLPAFFLFFSPFWRAKRALTKGKQADVRTEAQLHRTRNWKNVKSSEQQRAAQQSTVQNGDGGEATAATRDLPRLPSAVAKLRKLASSTQQVVVSQSQLVWDSIARPFANITRPIPRRSRRHSRAGVSIGVYRSLLQQTPMVSLPSTC